MESFKRVFICCLLLFLLQSCNDKNGKNADGNVREDHNAKRMLQGIWGDEDENNVTFRAKGDTIFYPDTTSQPVYFQIVSDTLVLHEICHCEADASSLRIQKSEWGCGEAD